MTIDEQLKAFKQTVERLRQDSDERYKRFDERLGAIAESLELVAGMQKDSEKRIEANDRLIAELAKTQAHSNYLHDEMMLALARLANTTHAHNSQLADHEDRIDNLEER